MINCLFTSFKGNFKIEYEKAWVCPSNYQDWVFINILVVPLSCQKNERYHCDNILIVAMC